MQILLRLIVSTVLLTSGLFVSAQGLGDYPSIAGPSESAGPFGAISGHPFSAIHYERRVQAMPNGKRRFIRNVEYPSLVARDGMGRVRMDNSDFGEECNNPEMLVPPKCPSWSVALFDPLAMTVTHWLEGEIAAPVAAEIQLSSAENEAIKAATSVLPKFSGDIDLNDSNVRVEALDEKKIEGIRALGVRITVLSPSTNSLAGKVVSRIREVWISTEMALVIQIVDGKPQGEQTISGIEHLSLEPNSQLFSPPSGYRIQHRNESIFAEFDIWVLGHWFVR